MAAELESACDPPEVSRAAQQNLAGRKYECAFRMLTEWWLYL